MTVRVVILRILAGEGRPHDPAVGSAQRLFRDLRKQRSLLLPGLPADQTMPQTQLQSGPLGGGMQHFDCGIGDFGPDPIARQHADLELALIRVGWLNLEGPTRQAATSALRIAAITALVKADVLAAPPKSAVRVPLLMAPSTPCCSCCAVVRHAREGTSSASMWTGTRVPRNTGFPPMIWPINRSLVAARVERISSARAPEMCPFEKRSKNIKTARDANSPRSLPRTSPVTAV